MSKNKHVYEIIGKDDYNIKLMNETLWDIKESIFDNLYTAQKALADMLRFDFDIGDASLITNNEVVFNLPTQFITTNRLAFKESEFYKKELTIDMVNSNTDIFANSVLVFIDGELYTNYYIKPMENITSIIFKLFIKLPKYDGTNHPGMTRADFKELVDKHARVTIFIVKSYGASIIKSNRLTIRNYSLVDKYLGLPMAHFKKANKIPEFDTFTTWLTYDDERLYKFRMVRSTKDENNKLYLDKEKIKELTNTYTHLQNLYLLNHFMILDISAGEEYFELPIKDMPIPIENMMVFKKQGNDLLFDHNVNMTLYYPNIYKFNEIPTDDLLIYVYYADDTKAEGSKYWDEITIYRRFNENILDQYKNNTIPDIIKNYKPITMEYDHDNLISTKVDHLKYKLDKLNSMIYQNGYYYSIYLNKLVGYIPMYDIDISEIEDLEERYRLNNYGEIRDISNKIEFPEPCYLFTFRYKPRDKFNILIDDLQTNELYTYHDEKYKYVYIPARMVKPNSLITVERFVDYRYRQDIEILDNETYHELKIPENEFVQKSDIFVTTKSLNDDDIYLSRNDYEIYHDNNGYYEKITINDFYRYKRFYIKFINPIDIGKRVKVNVNRVSFKQVVKGTNKVIISRDISNDKRNILLYRNGKLVPQKLRKYTFSDDISGPHTIKSLLKVSSPDDEFTLIYNTNKYNLVYYKQRINKKGIVDLTNKISKPIDFKWYDIYLNGLRLHSSNIEILGPYIFLLKNVPTLRNLEIYQKNLDLANYNEITNDDDYNTDDVSSRLFDDIKDDVEPTLPDINDTDPDIMDDMLIDIIEMMEEYVWTLFKLINPDKKQFNDQIIERYPTVFLNSKNAFINPDLVLPIERPGYLNPDTNTVIKL